MNNLLMRELPLRCTIRLWDTYLSEPDGCGSVLLYVCAAFLRHWREQLIRQKDFQVNFHPLNSNLRILIKNTCYSKIILFDLSGIDALASKLTYTKLGELRNQPHRCRSLSSQVYLRQYNMALTLKFLFKFPKKKKSTKQIVYNVWVPLNNQTI